MKIMFALDDEKPNTVYARVHSGVGWVELTEDEKEAWLRFDRIENRLRERLAGVVRAREALTARITERAKEGA